ncbi:hypothetical protein GJ496_004562 [Pomphorhynchus laevis]|nr:hypothetical protein GJ496_004562 [Pomphorhynchus laevis]
MMTCNRIPDSILLDDSLNTAIQALSENYDFEMHKTIWRIKRDQFKRVALQFPDGLLIFAVSIASIIESFTDAEAVIIGDVTYGACCIEDTTAYLLGCDLIIHYGHSCLISIDELPSGLKAMYIFVRISLDALHICNVIEANLKNTEKDIVLCGTIQFTSCIQHVKTELKQRGLFSLISIPQCKPLSPGELLGCTAPTLTNCENAAIVYIGDGRFHLEAMMIANPNNTAYQYDPYANKFTIERYDHTQMQITRKSQIEIAKKSKRFAVIRSTLGRQGSAKVTKNIENALTESDVEYFVCILSEIDNTLFGLVSTVDCWIQIACPRLSIDWGVCFNKPILNPYEAMVCLRKTEWKKIYPMDFYAFDSGGDWTPNNKSNRSVRMFKRNQHLKN